MGTQLLHKLPTVWRATIDQFAHPHALVIHRLHPGLDHLATKSKWSAGISNFLVRIANCPSPECWYSAEDQAVVRRELLGFARWGPIPAKVRSMWAVKSL
jgi:hypothetical protein